MSSNGIQHIALVGTGLIGSAWAAFFAGRGLDVTLYDPDPAARDRGLHRARTQLAFLREHGLADRNAATGNSAIRSAPSLADAVNEVQLVIESAPERYDVKTPLFEELDRLTAPDCILASSSSGLLMTQIQQSLAHPERTLIAHPFNPVHLIPLVELVGGEQTAPHVVQDIHDFLAGLGKTPVVLQKALPGHIGNRLQAAIWREAIQLVLDGVASVEDVDKALYCGPGLRWALMGQHLIFHLGGGEGGINAFCDHIGSSWSALWEDMANWTTLPADARAVLAEGVEVEMHGRSREELEAGRDRQLAALARIVQS